jgi:ribosome-binding factor A
VKVSFKRSDRVAEAIKREISELITRSVKDPRVHFATVMDVELTDDLRFAKIFVSVMGTEAEKAETMDGLQNALGFLRSEIGHRIRLRFTPEIRFYLDQTLDHAFRIEELLTQIKTEPAVPENQTEMPSEGLKTTVPVPEIKKAKKTSRAPRTRKPKEKP